MQPRSDLAIASRPPDTQARRSASSPRQPSAPTPRDRCALLTDLSAIVSHILGLQQSHAADAELQNRLRCTVAELERLISYLLRTDGSDTGSPPAAPQPSVNGTRQRAAEHAFLAWLADPTSAEELRLADGDAPEPLARILGELSLSNRVLPAEMSARLSLPDGTTIGRAAAELLLAVKDPGGPRCRSFRAAAFYLRDLDRFAWADNGKASR